MIIRTPRRRISPRTKQRYRAIRDFLKKALGTSSQADIKTNSSIAVSVSDLKNKIIGIEDQLHKVSKHCRDLSCLEHNLRKKSLHQSLQDEGINAALKSSPDKKESETKLLYKSSNRQCTRSEENNARNIQVQNQDDKNNMTSNNDDHGLHFCNFQENVKDYNIINGHRRGPSYIKTAASIYSNSSFHSLIDTKNRAYSKINCSGLRKEKLNLRKQYIEPLVRKDQRNREKIKKDLKLQDKTYEEQARTRKNKREHLSFDQDFIADIIKKQYKPVKLFGRRDSDFSQFSAPVCHDQEFRIRDDSHEDSELCSCCYDGRRNKRRNNRNDLSDIKSVCDARLYGSKRHRRHKYSRGSIDDYNNSTYYDVVPVKEKSSPKSRRKFAEDNVIVYNYCREVPPSPRSNRPRLNLKAQHHTEYITNSNYEKRRSRKNSPNHPHNKDAKNVYESDMSSDCFSNKKINENMKRIKSQKSPLIQEDVGTMSSLQYPNFINDQANLSNNDTTINTQLTESITDKTDKTLSEIKDILQSFLQEIKKESTHGQSEVSSKIDDKQLNESPDSNKINTIIPNSGHSFNNYGVGQCGAPPFVPAFTNPCCYPMMPMCPMNCLQNGYVIPTPSFTYNVCSKNSKPSFTEKDCCNSKNKTEDINTNNETQELIKEIYKFVSQNAKQSPCFIEHCNETRVNSKNDRLEKKILTSRSVGGSTKATQHDANVGTPNLKSQSKSCEAIGCRINSESFNTTNASYSDTILEKLSLEATQSSTESDVSSDVPKRKNKQSKLKKVLKSFRLLRKKYKKDVIEEESESESTVQVDVKPKSPFRQHITDYSMHGQEYYQPPPVPQPHCCGHHYHDGHHFHEFDLRNRYLQSPTDISNQHRQHTNQQAHDPRYTGRQNLTQPGPNYDPRLNHIPPQVPLCLKEIEVKSIGTQSVRKMSILQKLTAKTQAPQQPVQQPISISPVKEKSNFWKTLQEKAKQNNPDPMNFSMNTQKQLAQGDMKMRNAMLKKLFYKRNPFSPRNLIIKTILGRDKSSFGDPPKMYRPRMFL